MEQKKIVLFDIDYTLFRTDIFKETNLTQYFLYDEVEEVLEELGKTTVLGIFSEGKLPFQKEKLLQTHIHTYFVDEHVHIVEAKEATLSTILDIYKNSKVFLVDDKLPILHAAKKYLPSMYVIWVKRGYYAMKQEPIPGFSPDAIVSTLRDIISFIKESE